jgi:hypothetical protein
VETVTDPVEITAVEERHRQARTSARGQIGCTLVVDAPLPLLARYVAELPSEQRQAFFKDLMGNLPPLALAELAEALQLSRDEGAA